MLKFGNIGLKEIYNSLQKGDLLRGRVFNAIYIVVSKNIDYYSTRKVKIREIKFVCHFQQVWVLNQIKFFGS